MVIVYTTVFCEAFCHICKIPDTRSLNEANDANIEFKDRSIIFCGKMRQQYFPTQKEKDNGRTGNFDCGR